MTEHCDKCGTELSESQARHQRYWMENADESEEFLKGRLCSDCFWDFGEWLNDR